MFGSIIEFAQQLCTLTSRHNASRPSTARRLGLEQCEPRQLMAGASEDGYSLSAFQCDVNGDGYIAPSDVLMINNRLNSQGPGLLPATVSDPFHPAPHYDVNGDGLVTQTDADTVFDYINFGPRVSPVYPGPLPLPVCPHWTAVPNWPLPDQAAQMPAADDTSEVPGVIYYLPQAPVVNCHWIVPVHDPGVALPFPVQLDSDSALAEGEAAPAAAQPSRDVYIPVHAGVSLDDYLLYLLAHDQASRVGPANAVGSW